MNPIVIYTSNYGSAEKYARWIAEALGCPAKKLAEVRPGALAEYDTLIYGGGIYAGTVAGLKKFLARLGDATGKRLVLFMVGLANPADKAAYGQVAAHALPAEWQGRFAVFALRGDQLFSKMSGLHKVMMRVPKAMAEKKPPEARTDEDRLFIENFGKDIAFASRAQIEPLLAHLRQG